MELILLAVILFQFILVIYMDSQNRAERERLQLKLMSKDLGDYVSSTEEAADSPKEEPDPYMNAYDVSVDRIVNAKENE